MLTSHKQTHNFSVPIHLTGNNPRDNITFQLDLDNIIKSAIISKNFDMVSECLRLGANLGKAIKYCKRQMLIKTKHDYGDMLEFLKNDGLGLVFEDKEDPTELLNQVFLNTKILRKKI